MLKTSVRERNRRVQRGLQFKQRRLNLKLSRNNVLVKLQNTCVTQKHGAQVVLTVNSIANFEKAKGAYPVLESQLDKLYTELEAQQVAPATTEPLPFEPDKIPGRVLDAMGELNVLMSRTDITADDIREALKYYK